MNLNIYIGYDPRERAAFDVAVSSIGRRAGAAVTIRALKLGELSILSRPVERRDGKLWCPISQAPMATEFAISRFCVPFLQSRGWAIFVDCDILCWSDIGELFALADPCYAVMVVKHKQESGPATKMDGQAQLYYSKKNWSSVVLWNLDHPSHSKLTLRDLNTWPGRDLHAFKWLDDSEIGELPKKWNWLINVTSGEPKREGIWHYTAGGPWFQNWKPAPNDAEWIEASTCYVR